MKRISIFFALFFLVFGFGAIGRFAEAQTSTPVTVTNNGTIGGSNNTSVGLPGTHDPAKEGPVALIANLYDFALAVGGILAFGSILYGAVQYLAQPGNHEAQSSAKARLRDAFLGLLLLVGIYMILHLVNPGLTNLQFPILQRLAAPAPAVLSTPPAIDPNAKAYACVPHGLQEGDITKDPSKIKQCFTTASACDTQCPGGGNTNDCIVVSGSLCQNTNPATTSCTVGGKSLADLTPLSGDALILENGGKLQGTDTPGVHDNLIALNEAVQKFQNLLKSHGANLTVNSMYRPLEYQRHFYEIVNDWKTLQNLPPNPSNACVALKTKIDAEHQKHGLGTVVAAPSLCAPHVKGAAVDLSFTGISTQQAANLLSSSNINLFWRALDGDPVHFELKDPPYVPPGC